MQECRRKVLYRSPVWLAVVACNLQFLAIPLAHGGCDPATAVDDTIECRASTSPDPQPALNALAGNDTIRVVDGTINGTAQAEAGQDVFTVLGGSLRGNVYLGNSARNSTDADTFLLAGGQLNRNLYGDAGSDSFTLTGGEIVRNLVAEGGQDTLLLNGGLIRGSVYLGNTRRNSDDVDALTLNGATVNGNLNGDNGDDTLSLSAGRIGASVVTRNGEDQISLNGADIGRDINSGNQDDTLVLSGGSVGRNVITGSGDDRITLDGAVTLARDLNTGNDDDTLDLRAGRIGRRVLTGNGSDDITLSGSVVIVRDLNAGNQDDTIVLGGAASIGTNLDMGSGNNRVTMTGGTIGTDLRSRNNNDSVSVSGASVIGRDINTGGGADAVSIADTVSVGRNINAGGGADRITLAGGTLANDLIGGGGDDTVELAAGAAVGRDINLGNNNDQLLINGGSVGGRIIGHAGADDVNLAGGSITGNVYLGNTGRSSNNADSLSLGAVSVAGSIYGDRGVDTMSLSAGTVAGSVFGERGDDQIMLAGTVVSGDINAGDGNDTLTVTAGSAARLLGGNGNDLLHLDAFVGALQELASWEQVRVEHAADVTLAAVSANGIQDVSVDGSVVRFANAGIANSVTGSANAEDIHLLAGSIIGLDVLANDGADTLVLNGGTVNGQIAAGDGDDRIDLLGGSVGAISGGAGSDTLNWLGSISLTGAAPIDLGDDDDRLVVHGGVDFNTINSQVQGGAGSDTLVLDNYTGSINQLSAWENLTLRNGSDVSMATVSASGISYVSIEGSAARFSNTTIDYDLHGTASSETLSLLAGTSVGRDVDLGDGADVLVLDGADVARSVLTGAGDDQLQLLSGSVVIVDSGEGNDLLTLDGALVSNLIQAGAGDDVINLHSGSVPGILGASGDDIAHWHSGADIRGTVDLGDDDDRLVVYDAADLSRAASQVTGGAGNDALVFDNYSGVVNQVEGWESLGVQNGSDVDIATVSAGGIVNANVASSTVRLRNAVISADVVGTTGGEHVSLLAGTRIGGAVRLGDGSDTLILAPGADLSRLIAMDGGDDSSTLDGWVDSLIVDGYRGKLGATAVTNWERLVVRNNAHVELASGRYEQIELDNASLSATGIDVTGTVSGSDGDERLLLGSSSRLAAGIAMGGGADRLQLQGPGIELAGVIDGGSGEDQLTFVSYRDTVAIGNWERVTVLGDSRVEFVSGSTLLARADLHDMLSLGQMDVVEGNVHLQANQGLSGNIFIDALGRIEGAGDFTLSGSIGNRGMISAANGVIGDRVVIQGHYSGGGVFAQDVDLQALTADQLLIRGDVSGEPTVLLLNDSGSGQGSPGQLEIVQVEGSSDEEDFVLAGGYLDAGAYRYRLAGADGSWFLDSSLLLAPQLYAAVPSMMMATALQSTGGQLASWRERMGSYDAASGVWYRGYYSDGDYTPDSELAMTDFTLRNVAHEVGINLLQTISAAGADHFQFGLFGGRGHINSSLLQGDAALESDSNRIGLYGTWLTPEQTYIDVQAVYSLYDIDTRTAAEGSAGFKANAGQLSGEIGHRYLAGSGMGVEPQFQLSYTAYKQDAFRDSQGLQTELDSSHSLLARFGVRFDGEIALRRVQLVPFLNLDFMQEMLGDSRVMVNDQSFDTGLGGFAGGASAGLDTAFRNGFRIYADVRYRSGERLAEVYSGQLGLQYNW